MKSTLDFIQVRLNLLRAMIPNRFSFFSERKEHLLDAKIAIFSLRSRQDMLDSSKLSDEPLKKVIVLIMNSTVETKLDCATLLVSLSCERQLLKYQNDVLSRDNVFKGYLPL